MGSVIMFASIAIMIILAIWFITLIVVAADNSVKISFSIKSKTLKATLFIVWLVSGVAIFIYTEFIDKL